MTRPEATDPADLLRDDLRTIRECWDAMTPKLAAARPTATIGDTGARTSNRHDQDNGDHNTDVDRITIAVSARGDVLAVLASWCKVVIDDQDLRHAHIDGHSIDDVTYFLDRWAAWLAEHEACDDVRREVRECLQAVRDCLPRPRPDSVWIGDCPVTIGQEGDRVECGTPIRVKSGEPIRCRGCGTDDTLDGWMLRLVGHHDLVTAPQLTMLLHQRMGIRVTQDQIRQWVRRGTIRVADYRRDGRSTVALFDRSDVFTSLAYGRGA